MIEESILQLDDDPKVRAHVLSKAAESQRASSVYPPGLHSDGDRWRIGSLCFWKSEAFKNKSQSVAPFPPYDRGSLRDALYPDMRFDAERFTTREGRPAIAIVLRSDKDPKGTFGTFTTDEDEARRIIAFLNGEMDAARAIATERFRANGGDPAAAASQRAPSPSERLAMLDRLLGNPDEQ